MHIKIKHYNHSNVFGVRKKNTNSDLPTPAPSTFMSKIFC